jgi:hypothetical protein
MHTSNLRLIFKPPGQLLELGLNPDVFMSSINYFELEPGASQQHQPKPRPKSVNTQPAVNQRNPPGTTVE